MRNLAEYPITTAEAISAVEDALMTERQREATIPIESRPLGDIRQLALAHAIKLLKEIDK